MTYRETIAGPWGPAPDWGWLTAALWLGEGRLAGQRQIEYRIRRAGRG
jgi:hypothetical protein